MPAFHQIGHDSENLIFEEGLARFGGAILSPLNYTPSEVASQIARLKDRANFITILDPHLYRPQSDRLCLPEWSYYPKDVETADLSSESWWMGLVDSVANAAVELGPTAVCSPAIVPKTFGDEFFADLVNYGNRLEEALQRSAVKPIQTVVANLPELADPNRAMRIASIVSRSKIPQCLLVFLGDTEPRRELADPEELKGAMRLISTLEKGDQQVTVAFSSSDMVLWKAAGATNCATGKFFNLRRFTLTRFEEPSGGGGQLEYWFEESLLSFLRQSDLLRVQGRGLLSEASKANPFSSKILDGIPAKKAWVATGWRHFLHWFADAEHRIQNGAVSADDLVKEADTNWAIIEEGRPALFMEERRNDGAWVRQWRRALAEFPYFQ
jgi:hypothetical protein